MAKKHQTEYELNRRKLAKRYLKQERERKAEFDRRTEKPSARPAARLEFQRMNADYFLYLKKAFAAGHDMAFWDAVLNCMQPEIPMPDWVRDALQSYAQDRINRVPVKKPEGRSTNWLRDGYILTSVDWSREASRGFGRNRKPRPFSLNEACKKVKEELAKENVNLEVSTIRTAYDRAKKRFLSGSYVGSPHLNFTF